MAVYLNAYNFNPIGMHKKPCIPSLAFTACNWESLYNTDLILPQKQAFSTQNMMVH